MNVAVVWASPEVHDLVTIALPAGARVADAIAASGLVEQYGLELATLGFAIFGRRARADAPLADGDRVELTRPLACDPKTARARRARVETSVPSARRRGQARPKCRLP